MSSTYAGNSANNPASITIPSDGDAPIQVSDVNPAFEGIMDLIRRVAAVLIPDSLKIDTFTASGTFTVPANVNNVIVIGCGGGGGGGTGAGNDVNIAEWWCGGGGGGGALCGSVPVSVTPGAAIAVTIGAGGASGANGSDTTFGSLATFAGAKAGISATVAAGRKATNATTIVTADGGLSNKSQVSYINMTPSAAGFSRFDTAALPAGISWFQLPAQQVGQGGRGSVSTTSSTLAEPGGVSNVNGYAGGARGGVGADSGSYRGGGGGGGGAAGPFGAGGAGGSGGAANSAGASTIGGNGTAAAANTGAGGGGGGAAGAANAGAGGFANADSSGGAGGSGILYVVYTDGS